MNLRTWHPALGLYVVACVAALLFYLPNSANPEAAALLLIAMIVVTLPTGLLLTALLAWASPLIDVFALLASLGVTGQVIVWAMFLVVGFVQWGYFVPWAIRKLQTHTE